MQEIGVQDKVLMSNKRCTTRVDANVVEREKGCGRMLTTLRAAHAIHSYKPEIHTFTQIVAAE